MPEPKKSTSNRPFEAQVDSALEGMRLVRPAAAPKHGSEETPRLRGIAPTPEEPGLVSKLIDFIKTM